MASVFPYTNGLPTNDTFSDPLSTSPLNSPSHSSLHTDVNTAVETIETILQSGGGSRNLLYNGAMQVAQRGTSTASITTSNYYTADRWRGVVDTQGTWTQSVENDAPSGSGFSKSLKMLCTTADASPAAADDLIVSQYLEGQDLQAIRKGTASAQQLTLSFWVKSNVTGTYICELRDADNTRQVSKSYTISASATWEFKTLTFPADTTGAFDNDNARSLDVNWWLGAGSNYTSGTLNTSWASITNANRVVGQVNLASATNNYWQVTGLQLNVGSVAAPFEFKSFGEELAECQRYFISYGGTQVYEPVLAGIGQSTTRVDFMLWFPVEMRTSPSAAITGNWQVSDSATATAVTSLTASSGNTGNKSTLIIANVASGLTQYRPYRFETANSTASRLQLSAEL